MLAVFIEAERRPDLLPAMFLSYSHSAFSSQW